MDRHTFDQAFDQLPIGRDPASVRRRIEAMERLLEGAFPIPGMQRRFGLDSILGLIPVVGDVASAAMGAWLIWEARNLGMSRLQIARMSGNLVFDTALGMVPLVGDAFDFFFRSNSRNLRIVRKWLDRHHPATGILEGQVIDRRAG